MDASFFMFLVHLSVRRSFTSLLRKIFKQPKLLYVDFDRQFQSKFSTWVVTPADTFYSSSRDAAPYSIFHCLRHSSTSALIFSPACVLSNSLASFTALKWSIRTLCSDSANSSTCFSTSSSISFLLCRK